jgi:hypothetical protein
MVHRKGVEKYTNEPNNMPNQPQVEHQRDVDWLGSFESLMLRRVLYGRYQVKGTRDYHARCTADHLEDMHKPIIEH